MEKLNPYLTFPGNCEEAFNFYRSVFGGDFLSIGRFSDMQSDEGVIVPEYKMNKIMYISLPIGEQTVLMGSDSDEEWSPAVVSGNNISLSITAKTKEDADRFFESLSGEGKIIMQIGDVFWGSYYGMCTDKFGVNWAVCYEKKETDD
ncbi:MAG TPA: VOC family protein [Salinimicrobium catena]|uniref:VOC family protein n=1 Tax=Salinimicrobium catena TaxID=390640 RepID=A0A7C2M9G4_9FLAO|nr:VOC family protein [Salinimicrobium catena]